MTHFAKQDNSLNTPGSVRLLHIPIRTAVEEAVSEYIQQEWRIRNAKDMSDFACHPCAVLSDNSYAIFTKYSEDASALHQFEIECACLQYLSDNTGVMIPTPITILPAGKGTVFIMEALNPVERTPLRWRQIGENLARIHRITSEQCGFQSNGFVGPVFQDNTPAQDWMTFYRDRRLVPRLKLAVDSGNIPAPVAGRVEKLIHRLPEYCGPEITPTLLHGDAQQNNFISTEKGTYIIDPAIYFGNPEIDLALIDCFSPVPDDVFEGYKEDMPIAPDFPKRRGLWRIAIYLAAVAIEGTMHLNRLTNALKEYV